MIVWHSPTADLFFAVFLREGARNRASFLIVLKKPRGGLFEKAMFGCSTTMLCLDRYWIQNRTGAFLVDGYLVEQKQLFCIFISKEYPEKRRGTGMFRTNTNEGA